jgi:hypothetical protein
MLLFSTSSMTVTKMRVYTRDFVLITAVILTAVLAPRAYGEKIPDLIIRNVNIIGTGSQTEYTLANIQIVANKIKLVWNVFKTKHINGLFYSALALDRQRISQDAERLIWRAASGAKRQPGRLGRLGTRAACPQHRSHRR